MSHLRRLSLVAVPALALSTLAFVPAAPSSAAEPDPTPVSNGVDWLAGQLTDGLMHNDQFDFDDLGLSTDTGLAMAYLDETDTAGDIADALAPRITEYYTYDVGNSDGPLVGTHVSAGSLAKAAAFVDAAGDDPTDFGGHDLIAELEDRVSTEPGTEGRIGDVFFPDEAFEADFSNTLGQSFAVNALDAEGSVLTDSATDFLLAQQCEEGFFRLSFAAPDAADQTCDGDAASSASTDVTALAVLNLASQSDDTDIQAAIDTALAWLDDTQGADGSFGSDGEITTPNANSTGLAGWALGDAGETDAATAAAVWLRQHQADDFGPCTTGLTAETGAIAYDDAALSTGRSEGLDVAVQDQFRRGTAQALPALLWAPAGTYSTEPVSTDGFVRAGSTQPVYADAVAPGQTVCFALGASQTLVHADLDGNAAGTVELPGGSGTRVYDVGLTDGVLGTITFNALAAEKLGLKLKKAKVAKKKKQKVVVKGLATGESVRVLYKGKVKDEGTAGGKGRFVTTFKVGKQAGKQKVKVRGEFGNRKAAEKFRVKGR
ncbi:prenyltransferase/squalene oxidase repeat-containing protein [Nocardioides sp.]|uniref:prenyltransferase/squalene oxidase repeat-containing protein n=1 Tax=Nocardioides sp. TaxID=35761 RepID=UPI0026153B50|nr:prenyltransferase/squalene oxidase repeat-containing protein [Nocardioides sp.]